MIIREAKDAKTAYFVFSYGFFSTLIGINFNIRKELLEWTVSSKFVKTFFGFSGSGTKKSSISNGLVVFSLHMFGKYVAHKISKGKINDRKAVMQVLG